MGTEKILVLGSGGQIGTELVEALKTQFGNENVISSDIKKTASDSSPFETIDVLDFNAIHRVADKYKVTQIYLLAALLSATAEQKPKVGWKLNMEGLFNVLDIATEKKLKVFWPSSIAAFGPTTPKKKSPQTTIMEPTTVYGISKQAGERWCEYYNHKYGLDVRSIRYPGLISYKAAPGGGTTDYAVNIFHEAIEHNRYECFLKADTALPMMYMPDAIRATIELMSSTSEKIKIRSSYNLSSFSFSPAELAEEIKKHLPGFNITYQPDYRQSIAETWPQSIDDSVARSDWGWKHQYDLTAMVKEMLLHIGDMKNRKVFA
ncbi:MAG: NAD-dependent epimerase/dehydratase family protein [Bacteroidia bacterium]